MRTKVLSVAALLLVVMIGFAFQWRYDEVVLGGRKQLVRTNRFTGNIQRLSEYGWLPEKSTSYTSPATPSQEIPRYMTEAIPACIPQYKGLEVFDTTESRVKTCDGTTWQRKNPYLD